jgi:putative acetyltransferase
MAVIRRERSGDSGAVRRVHERAFGGSAEADIVEDLREGCPETVSLVAAEGRRIVGHICFSPVTVSGARHIRGMGLAPLAVRPERQQRGIGTRLVRAGVEVLRSQGRPFVCVLGHPRFYLRCGFAPASERGLGSPWPDLPDEIFMVLVLDERKMAGISGSIRYRWEMDPPG